MHFLLLLMMLHWVTIKDGYHTHRVLENNYHLVIGQYWQTYPDARYQAQCDGVTQLSDIIDLDSEDAAKQYVLRCPVE